MNGREIDKISKSMSKDTFSSRFSIKMKLNILSLLSCHNLYKALSKVKTSAFLLTDRQAQEKLILFLDQNKKVAHKKSFKMRSA